MTNDNRKRILESLLETLPSPHFFARDSLAFWVFAELFVFQLFGAVFNSFKVKCDFFIGLVYYALCYRVQKETLLTSKKTTKSRFSRAKVDHAYFRVNLLPNQNSKIAAGTPVVHSWRWVVFLEELFREPTIASRRAILNWGSKLRSLKSYSFSGDLHFATAFPSSFYSCINIKYVLNYRH